MTTRERQRQRRRRHSVARNKAILTLSVLVGCGAIAVLGLVGYIVAIAASAPSIDSLRPVGDGASSVVYAADGRRLGFIQSDALRSPIPSSQIPRELMDATIAIEDERYYSHHGVDYEGVIRAAFENAVAGKTLQGGSTITMQLVRNLYISRERTFERKIREAKLAQELEKEHSKQWILTKYLNTVPYGTVGGQTAIGVQAAARTFFDKPASELNLAQSALISGLPQAPSRYNPLRDPRLARERRNEVLDRMANLGMITRSEAERAQVSPLGIKQGRFYTKRRENYFFDYVKQQLIDLYGVNTVQQGGLRIYTTIDLEAQKAARLAIAGQLNQPGDPSSAVVSIDPENGYIKAMVSSGNYEQNQFNLAAQGHRQPGSTFKTMVLMTALRRGVDPNKTSYVSKPLDLNTPFGPWKVKTYSNDYGGSMDLVRATLRSDNTIFAQLDLDLGPDQVRQTAYDMGITTKLDGYPAEGLGGLRLGVSPLEMTNAYATIASGGWRNKPIAITRVEFPDGRSDDLGRPQRTKEFEDGVTAEATKILEANVQSGTGTAAGVGCPAAGKTGTTDSFTDAWFVGFTPKLATGVWVGYPNSRVEMNSVHGIAVAGGTFPARIWHDYMAVAKGGDCSEFAKPEHPLQFQPFFGKYATTGTSEDEELEDESKTDTTEEKDKKKKKSTKLERKTGGETGDEEFDPRKYEAPPQEEPKVPEQETTPETKTTAPAPQTTPQTTPADQGEDEGGAQAPPA